MFEENGIEIFKCGTHTDMSGNVKSYNENDLDNIVSKYDSKKHEAPFVIGHPTTTAPAYGWVDSLKRIGQSLYAIPKQVNEDFKNMVNSGSFKKRSCMFRGDGSLVHVGWLGATPPAIKGLADYAFSEKSEEIKTYEFSESKSETETETEKDNFIIKIVSALKEYFVPKEIKNEKLVYSEGNEKMEKEKEDALNNKIAELEKAVATYSEQVQKKESTILELTASIEKTKSDAKKLEYSAFCEGLIKEGKMLPAKKEFWLNQLVANDLLPSAYSEGKQNPNEALKTELNSNPVILSFAEHKQEINTVSKNIFDDARKINDYIAEQKNKGIEVSYSEALDAITTIRQEN